MMKNNVVFRPTVVIGLGGTGYGAVVKIKKRFIDAYGSVPPIIRFLTIDTTENAEASAQPEGKAEVQLDPHEQYVIQVVNPAALVGGANEHIDEWWPREIPVSAILAGAGQVRARGRLALFARATDVIGKIQQAVDDVRNIRNQKQMYADQFQVSTRAGVEVHIVSSLAGGTGSGLFLDIAFIARAVIGSDESSNFTGVLLLPRLFTRYAGTHLVKSNAYGALKEIEYLSTSKTRFQIDYGMRTIDVTRPPFDLVYLIDSINEQGRTVMEQNDLLGLIADGLYVQIGSQIGTDSANAVDNIKTQISTIGLVKGRSPQYCSFGVASLVLPNFDALMFEDAKRLVNDDLLGGAITDPEIEDEVQRFIENNRLREETTSNQVIDFLSVQKGGGQLRIPMSLGQMKYDAKALATIKSLHASHRSKAERQIAQTIGANFTTKRDEVVKAITTWWEASVNQVNGFTHAERFFEKLQAKLEWYQNMMLGEANDERTKLKALNFKPADDHVQEAVKALIRREARVRAACEQYCAIANRETELTIAIARLEKAAEFYSVLHAHTESLLNSSYRIRENLNAARKQFEQKHLDVTASRGLTRLFEQVIRFEPGENRPELSGADFAKWYTDQARSLSQWASYRAADVHRDIEEYIEKRYEALTALTMDDVIRRSPPEFISQELKRLDHLAVPLWRYDLGKIPVVNQTIINEFYHYGVGDAETTVLKESKYEAGVPKGNAKPSMVSTRDGRRILLFKVKTGIPLFALHEIEDLERAYMDPNKVVSNHIDLRWHDLPNVIPRTGDGDALRVFAVAQAPEPFALIQRVGAWYSMKSKSGRRVDNSMLRLAQGRVSAYATFEKNRELVQEAQEIIDSIVTREGAAKVARLLKDYAESLAKQMAGPVEPAVKDQVENEIHAIEDYIGKMETLA